LKYCNNFVKYCNKFVPDVIPICWVKDIDLTSVSLLEIQCRAKGYVPGSVLVGTPCLLFISVSLNRLTSRHLKFRPHKWNTTIHRDNHFVGFSTFSATPFSHPLNHITGLGVLETWMSVH
jgi:hypothetical protein